MSVKRWYCRLAENDEGVAYAAEMAEGPRSGNYVLHSDYEALAAELDLCNRNKKFATDCHDEATQEVIALEARVAALEVALRELSAMYTHAWDRVDGCLVMLPASMERFENAHDEARRLLVQP